MTRSVDLNLEVDNGNCRRLMPFIDASVRTAWNYATSTAAYASHTNKRKALAEQRSLKWIYTKNGWKHIFFPGSGTVPMSMPTSFMKEGKPVNITDPSLHLNASHYVKWFPKPKKMLFEPPPQKCCRSSVKTYQHGSFNGKETTFTEGMYDIRAMTRRGQKNDDMSSIIVPTGCKVIAYSDHKFNGKEATFTPGRYSHRKMVKRFPDDDLSSLKVISMTHCPTSGEEAKKEAKKVIKEFTCKSDPTCRNGVYENPRTVAQWDGRGTKPAKGAPCPACMGFMAGDPHQPPSTARTVNPTDPPNSTDLLAAFRGVPTRVDVNQLTEAVRRGQLLLAEKVDVNQLGAGYVLPGDLCLAPLDADSSDFPFESSMKSP